MSFKSFETERLHLRPLEERDAESYERHFVSYAVISQLSAAVPWPYPKGGVLDYLKALILPKQGNDSWHWGIFLKEKPDECIGAIGLWRPGIPENRGFWLGEEFWGKGYMTEAVKPVTDYAFNDLGFEKLVFSNALGNEKSRRIKVKTGARLIGTRPAKFVDPNYSEAETWELSKEEWEKSSTSGAGGES